MILLFELTNNSTYMPDIRIERKKTNYKKLLLPVSLLISLVSVFFLVTKSGLLNNDSTEISPKAMKEDINFFFDEIERIHPRLDRFFTYEQIDSVRETLINECNHSLELNEFQFKLIKTRYLFDDHTGCIFDSFKFEEQLGRNSSSNECLLPMVNIQGNKVYWRNQEVTQINGINLSEVLTELHKMVSPTNSPQYNDIYMSYLFSFYLLDRYGVVNRYELKRTSGDLIACDSLLTVSEYNYSYYSKWGNNGSNYFEHHLDKSLSVFYFNKCDMSDATINTIDKGFKYIKDHNIKYLLVDVSSNGGGDDSVCFYIIDKYLAHKEFCLEVEQILKPAVFYEFLKIHNATGSFPESYDSTSVEITSRNISLLSKANTDGFNGKLIVMQGPGTYSASILFCKLIRMFDLGIGIGQGVGHEHLFAGNMYEQILPNSKFLMRCASTLQVGDYKKYNFDRFITPKIDIKLPKTKNIDSLINVLPFINN